MRRCLALLLLKRFPNNRHHQPNVCIGTKKKEKDLHSNQNIREMFGAVAQKKSKNNTDVKLRLISKNK